MKTSNPMYSIVKIGVFLLLIGGAIYLLKVSTGVVTYLVLTIGLSCLCLYVRECHILFGRRFHRDITGSLYINILLSLCSVMLVLMLFELYLQINHQEGTTDSNESLTMPEAWKKRSVDIEGAKAAHYWHGKLHVFNEVGMRRTTPFPPKNQDVCRIMVVGDSLTYGQGVDANDTYSSVIEMELLTQYRVEVLNLGICGVQSEDILRIVYAYVPQLKPDIIVYGVCLNDFLESGELERSRARKQNWLFPLPKRFKNMMIHQTLSGEFFEKSYDDLLMRLGIRADFYNNILRNLYEYQIRFTRDTTIMNYFVLQHRLPPIIVMVLDQYPKLNGRGHKVARVAESIMKLVGMEVISIEEYYQTYNGRAMNVSRWEGHPNEEAHRVFAEYFIQRLRIHPVLQFYKK